MTLLWSIVLLLVGFVLLIKGADWFVDGASGIAAKFGIPQIIIGLTIVAMGTSAPEAAISITAAAKGSADITIGNIVGSNILNVWVILGLSALFAPLLVAKKTLQREVPFTIAITVLLLLLGLDGAVQRWDGAILWVCFLAYLSYLFVQTRRNRADEPTVGRARKLWQLIAMTVVGIGCIVLGSNVTVDAASEIARYFGWSERLIGLTIVAFGTSLPELFTSVAAARKGNAGIAIGNIVGSNIFNILFVVGTSALVTPVPFAAAFRLDTCIAAAAVVTLLLFCLPRQRLSRPWGAVMLALYAGYFVWICL